MRGRLGWLVVSLPRSVPRHQEAAQYAKDAGSEQDGQGDLAVELFIADAMKGTAPNPGAQYHDG